MLTDTHPEAERVQLDLIRKMTIAERLTRAAEWTQMAVNTISNILRPRSLTMGTCVRAPPERRDSHARPGNAAR